MSRGLPAIPAAFSPVGAGDGIRFQLRGSASWSRYVLAGLTLGTGGLGFALLDASPGAGALLLGVGVGLAGLTGWRWSRAEKPLSVTVTDETLSWEGNDGPVALPLASLQRVEALGDRKPTLLLRATGALVELDASGHTREEVAALAAAFTVRSPDDRPVG